MAAEGGGERKVEGTDEPRRRWRPWWAAAAEGCCGGQQRRLEAAEGIGGWRRAAEMLRRSAA